MKYESVNRYRNYSVLILVFLFPILCISVEHAGSTIFGLFFLMGVIFSRSTWKELAAPEKSVLRAYGVFTAVVLLSLFNVDDWPSTITRLERILRILAIVFLYLLFRSVKIDLLKPLLYGTAIGCLVLFSQAAYYSQFNSVGSLQGAYNKIIFGDISMLLVVIVLVALVTVAKKRMHFAVAGICVAAGLFASVMSGARGAWLLVPILIPVIIYLYRHLLTVKHFIAVTSGLAVIILTAQYWLPNVVLAGVESGFKNIHQYQKDPQQLTSWGVRLNMWNDSMTMLKQHPVIGVGLGDYAWEREALMAKGEAIEQIHFDHAHSIYFDTLATTGVVGFLALVLCLFMSPARLFRKAWKTTRRSDWDSFAILAGICTLVAFAVFGLSETWLARNPLLNIFLIFTALFAANTGRFLFDDATGPEQPDLKE